MLKAIKICLAAALAVIVLATGCAGGAPREETTAPDILLKDLDGQAVSLSGLKGRPVLLNFWATWCGPCRSEMPYLQEIHEDPEWRAKNLLILAVNLQESGETVRKFMTDNKFNFTVLLDTKGEAGRLYNVNSIPATYIINKDGIIMDNRIGAFVSKNQIEQMLLSAIDKN